MKWLAGLVSRVGLGSGYKWLPGYGRVSSSSLYYLFCFVYNIIIMKKYVPVAAAVVV